MAKTEPYPYCFSWTEQERQQIDMMLQTSPSAEARRKIGDVVIRNCAARHVRDRVTGRSLHREKYHPATSQLSLLRPKKVRVRGRMQM